MEWLERIKFLILTVVAALFFTVNVNIRQARDEISRLEYQIRQTYTSKERVILKMSTLSTTICWVEGKMTRQTVIETVQEPDEEDSAFIIRHNDMVAAFVATVEEVPCSK